MRINNPNEVPWIIEGISYLLPKESETEDPKNYRKITYLSTTYKLITSGLTKCTYAFLDESHSVSLEMKEFRRGSYVCKDKLVIKRIFLGNCWK